MEDRMTTKEAAKLWKTSEAVVSTLCEDKMIQAVKCAGRWFIPAGTTKPEGLAALSEVECALPLGVGEEDYKVFSTEAYYVDKTLMLKEIIDMGTGVYLFARPRRFGKSLNLNMAKMFFERSEEDNSVYFVDKKIWSCGRVYQRHQGRYPVIYLTLKEAAKDNWEETYDKIRSCLITEIDRHPELALSGKCTETEKKKLALLLSGEASQTQYEDTFLLLSGMLQKHYGSKVVIAVDEYDTPIQKGYLNGYYNEIVGFLRGLFGAGLKGNQAVRYGLFTGILRVAKESIFSGANNFKVFSVLDPEFSTCFGYTADEVLEMAAEYHAEDKMDEIRTWYNGYVFGGTQMYNSWSVSNYFERKCRAVDFWDNTSGNELVGELIGMANADILQKLQDLLNGKTLREFVDINVVYPDIKNNPSSIFSFLVATGYLKVMDDPPKTNGSICQLAIPNQEVLGTFRKQILDRFAPGQESVARLILDGLEHNNWKQVQTSLETFLYQSASYFDTSAEGFYHGFVLGLSAAFAGYYVTSNRESGDGRYDIELEPRMANRPGILLEFKSLDQENYSKEKLHREAEDALKQIHDNRYDENLKKRNVHTIYKYGIAFCSKKVDVVAET